MWTGESWRDRCGQENLRESYVWSGESWRELGVDRKILERDRYGQENLGER